MGSRLVRILIAALIAVGVLIPALLFFRQQPAAAANMTLSILNGSAEVARGSGAFARVGDGHVLSPGDRVRTTDQSHAIVTFFDGSTVELEPATTITMVQASSAPGGTITIELEQAIGRTWSSIQKLARADSTFELKTPTMAATVRGTGFITDVLTSGTTTVTTTDGLVEVSAQGQTVLVPTGSLTTVPPSAPPSPPAPAPRPQNTLRLGLHSPALLVVVDPLGRACGIVPTGPTLVRQIPGCLATETGIDPQLVELTNAPLGAYTIVIESIAPGGDFVATASALDGAGDLLFNYTLSGGGPAGTRFGSRLTVESGANGALRATGLGKLALLDRTPVHVVVPSTARLPATSGTPDSSLFAPLPRFGFTAGIEVTPPPSGQTPPPSASSSATPSPTPSPAPTEVTTPEPTPAPTAPPVRALPPPQPPAPTPTPAPTPQPTAAPTPTPVPTPTGPTVSGGVASPGSAMNVTGRGWSSALITISWEDGRPLVQVTADASGAFAVAITVPFDASVGSTYRITASDGRLTATGQVAIYAPTIAVSCATVGSPVSVTGNGWPALARYALRSSLLATPLSGSVGADGAFTISFTPPTGTLPGDYLISANVGSLLAEAQTCTLR